MSSAGNLKVPLFSKKDSNGNTYYIGKLQFPGNINCTDGINLLIFTSSEGDEELQISGASEKQKEYK